MLLTGCERRADSYEACRTPRQLSVEDLSGKWTANYAEHYVYDPLPGTVVMSGTANYDFHYLNPLPTIVTISDTQAYLIAPSATPFSLADCGMAMELDEYWTSCSLLRNSPRYLMSGIETLQLDSLGAYSQTHSATMYQAKGRWELVMDTPDAPKLRIHGMRFFPAGKEFAKGEKSIFLTPQLPDLLKGETSSTETGVVHYPEDGYVYLYPRRCAGELVLQQMVFGGQEPDSATIIGPIFKRQPTSLKP